MPILIALSVVALISLTKPFRGLAFGLLLLVAAVCFGIAMILWRFWLDCRNAIMLSLGCEDPYRKEEETQHFRVIFNNLPQGPGVPVPLRLPAPKRGKGSHTEAS